MTFTVATNPDINSETAVIRPNIRSDAYALITNHEAIEASRHVVLDTPPHELFQLTKFNVKYTVGQALWTTFPILHDGEGHGSAPWDLISFDYVDKVESMPWPASQFYRVSAESSRIYGHEFREENVGTHTLNVTIADPAGS